VGYTFLKILFVPLPPHYFYAVVMGQNKDSFLIFLKVRKKYPVKDVKDTNQWTSTCYLAGVRVTMYFRIFLSVCPMLSEYLTVFEVYFYSSFAK